GVGRGRGASPGARRVRGGAGGQSGGSAEVLAGKAFVPPGGAAPPQETAVPADLADGVQAARESLVETIAEANDELLEKYLEGQELSLDELRAGLREGTRSGKFLPILCGAAAKGIGVHALLDAIVDLLASPADLPAWAG